MQVHVRARGDQDIRRDLLGSDTERVLDLPEGALARELSTQIGTNLWQIGAVSVNGTVVKPDHPLKDGDRVEILIVMVGG